MDDNELLRITDEDIHQANQLSLSCPICASPVENNNLAPELTPVVCIECDTLYHHVCWNNNGGKCAILGCNCSEYRVYGTPETMLVLSEKDLPSDREVQRQKELKRLEQQQLGRRVPSQRQAAGFWSQLYQNILRAFGVRRST